ncbi:MAG TPA: type IV pilus secretin PilQ [Candidatus Binatia bacterium]|nr:type IV pilus secretin PilQ [Candidatus Binatia bacterium]
MRGLRWGVVLLVLGVCWAPPGTPAASAAEPSGSEADSPSAAPAGAPAPPADQAAPVEPDAASLAVRDVHVEPAGKGRRVVIQLSRAPDDVRQFTLSGPPRLVIDLAGPRTGTGKREARFPLSDDEVSRVRVAPYHGRLRVVLDLSGPVGHYRIQRDGTTVVAELGEAGAEPLAMLAPLTVAPADAGADKGTAAAEDPIEVADAAPVPAQPAADPRPAPARPAAAAADPGFRLASAALPPPPAPKPLFTGQKISLDFKDADIQNVLRVLADVSGENIIATDDVKGKVTLHLVDIPWDQALDLVLHSNRLEMQREGNVVRISTVARLKEEREALRAAQEAARELEPLKVEYVRVNYARADDALVDKVKGVLTDRGSVTFDDRTNTIIVRDIQKGLDDARELIHQLDVQSPQVLIEAHLVEATEDFARGLGIQWGYSFQAGPLTGNPTGSNFPGTIALGGSQLGAGTAPTPAVPGITTSPVPFLADFPVPANFGSGFGPGAGSALDLALGSIDGTQALAARLTALEQEGKGKVISRPRVITMNNVAATIESLTILRVKLPSTGTVVNTGAGGVAGGATVATEKINTGITLVVTPQISSDGFVLMNIFAKSSQPDFTHTVDNIPAEVSRQANSNVLIHDGDTVVLGGIFRHTANDTESGLPYLRSIPVLGWLFKNNLVTTHHEELLVFLTPKVVSTGTAQLPAADRLWEERQKGG